MKKFFVFVLAASAFAACIKSSNPPVTSDCVSVAPSVEESTIKAFTNADTISYTKDTSYIYYHIVDSGSGQVAPTTIFFTYKVTLLNGTLIDQRTTPVSAAVTNLIKGFQYMSRFYKKGAHIILIIPSALGYGCEGAVSNGTYIIPPNSILYYNFTVTDVQ